MSRAVRNRTWVSLCLRRLALVGGFRAGLNRPRVYLHPSCLALIGMSCAGRNRPWVSLCLSRFSLVGGFRAGRGVEREAGGDHCCRKANSLLCHYISLASHREIAFSPPDGNSHEGSHGAQVVPVLISTNAPIVRFLPTIPYHRVPSKEDTRRNVHFPPISDIRQRVTSSLSSRTGVAHEGTKARRHEAALHLRGFLSASRLRVPRFLLRRRRVADGRGWFHAKARRRRKARRVGRGLKRGREDWRALSPLAVEG